MGSETEYAELNYDEDDVSTAVNVVPDSPSPPSGSSERNSTVTPTTTGKKRAPKPFVWKDDLCILLLRSLRCKKAECNGEFFLR